MDKRKTGNLIKEARTKKNLTQNELGELIGVTNKAVSRWENGESFPDIGVLETLSNVLDISIQDIVIGEQKTDDKSAITEVVRIAKIQQSEKKHKTFMNGLLGLVLILLLWVGYNEIFSRALFHMHGAVVVCCFAMVVSFGIILAGHIGEGEEKKKDKSKIGKWLRGLSVLFFAGGIGFGFVTCLMCIESVPIPFGVKLHSLGPIILGLLIILFIFNITLFCYELYRRERYDVAIHWGYLFLVATMYWIVLYSDLLFAMDTPGAMLSLFFTRMIMVIITLIISVGIMHKIR